MSAKHRRWYWARGARERRPAAKLFLRRIIARLCVFFLLMDEGRAAKDQLQKTSCKGPAAKDELQRTSCKRQAAKDEQQRTSCKGPAAKDEQQRTSCKRQAAKDQSDPFRAFCCFRSAL